MAKKKKSQQAQKRKQGREIEQKELRKISGGHAAADVAEVAKKSKFL